MVSIKSVRISDRYREGHPRTVFIALLDSETIAEESSSLLLQLLRVNTSRTSRNCHVWKLQQTTQIAFSFRPRASPTPFASDSLAGIFLLPVLVFNRSRAWTSTSRTSSGKSITDPHVGASSRCAKTQASFLLNLILLLFSTLTSPL